ncbi:hypothetical protein Goklo_002408 [Gossypium klotzschianum]|uniref:GOLD domain-containing protein n=1 Tax=Gossypium klotzschianum TaxID=34286 RepID=A0A7J8VTN9_9ROSI|nr:hypothetical protein [Gossypium klotzschianum]
MCGLNLGLIVIMIGLVVETEIGKSMRFELDSGKTKCIAEDIMQYSIVNPSEGLPFPDSHKLVVRRNNYHLGDQVDSGTFAFTAAESGDYTTCFWANKHKPPVKMTIEFDWKSGVAAKDWSKVAKKGQVETMEIELKKLYDTVSAIHEEMFYLRERDEEMQELNKETNSKMFSLLLCLSVAGLQIWHLKSFFESKKLL